MKAAILLATLAVIASAFFALAPEANRAAHLQFENIHVRPVGDTGVLLLDLTNSGVPDRLISARSATHNVTLYSPEAQNGVPIPSGTASLALDGAHVALTTPEAGFTDGDLIPVTLTFEQAGDIALKARLHDPAQAGAAQSAGLFGLGDICVVEDGEPAPAVSLQISETPEGVMVTIDSSEFTFSKDLLGLYHVPGMGHGHIYVGGMKLGRLFEPSVQLGDLPKGEHVIRVTLNTNDHRAYVVNGTPVTASAAVVIN